MPLPQLVPSRVCFQCDVCCRFPERDSLLRPYFTAEEIRHAVARGVDPSHFSDPNGCQISVVPNPSGEGYLCPAFDPQTSHCRIYEDRPLDCQIYPLAVMWAAPTGPGSGFEVRGSGQDNLVPRTSDLASQAEGREPEVVLGWDTKCPFMRDAVPSEILAYAETITALLERADVLAAVAANPRLVGRFQEDVVILRPLPKLSERMRVTRDALRVTGVSDSVLVTRHPSLVTRPLTLADHDRFQQAFARVDTTLAHYALAPHLIWRHLFTYSWAEIEGHLCLFADYADGMYMPLPPLPLSPVGREAGSRFEVRGSRQENLVPRTPHPVPTVFSACFEFMRKRNNSSAVSRIENVPEEWDARLEAMGYRVKPKDPDYLYRAADLVALAGDPYKSQRAACNRFEREHRHTIEPYCDEDREACLALFRDWSAQKQATGEDAMARQMLADSESAHREALTHHHELGLAAHVVRVDGRIRAYTFGYRRSPSVFCVLLEVADRTIPGLAPFIFREFCREAAAGGSEFVNTMDDSGLPSLAHAKRTYHPVRLVPSYIVTEL